MGGNDHSQYRYIWILLRQRDHLRAQKPLGLKQMLISTLTANLLFHGCVRSGFNFYSFLYFTINLLYL